MSIARTVSAEGHASRQKTMNPGRESRNPERLHHQAELFDLFRQQEKQSKALTRRFGISPQLFDAILEVAVCPDPDGISIGGLANRLGIKHNSVVSIVNRLSAKGLAIRTACSRDRRWVFVHATQPGRILLQDLVREMQETWSQRPVYPDGVNDG